MRYRINLQGEHYRFSSLKEVMAKASPLRSADELAQVCARNEQERMAARYLLSEVPLRQFLQEPLIPYEEDEVSRLILKQVDQALFAPYSSMSVGEFKDFLLRSLVEPQDLTRLKWALTPEMVAATSKLMSLQEMVAVSKNIRVVTRFRTTVGLPGTLSTRLQPNHPTDDPRGILASVLDGLLLGSGDAVVGINPASDTPTRTKKLLQILEEVRLKNQIPMQSCVLSHVTTALALMKDPDVPLDLVFQSIAGSEKANASFGINLSLLDEAHKGAQTLKRNPHSSQLMYFETGQGSALSAEGHFGVDAQTMEARAYAVAREFDPFLVNTVVGFIGPEYLYNGKQIIRAGIEDHFCGKLLGLPMGCDICYTNHAMADGDDMDVLLSLLGMSGCSFIMGVPGSDDIMLNYQSTSFHDAWYLRDCLRLKPAPEFQAWLEQRGIMEAHTGRLLEPKAPWARILA